MMPEVNQIYTGDCLSVMKTWPDNFVDTIICDPPYELNFMSKRWDSSGIAFNVNVWKEALRVAKPGAMLLAFGGTRTYHRLAVAIEDAGWQIRDCLMWLYGSGFPKSLDISKAIDKARKEDDAPIRNVCRFIRAAMEAKGLASKDLVGYFGGCHPRLIDHWAARDTDSQPSLPTWEQWIRLRELLSFSSELDAEVWRLNGRKGQPGDDWKGAEVIGEHDGVPGGLSGERFTFRDKLIREPASPLARTWSGWGTALKPAHEPIIVAQKPFGEVESVILKTIEGLEKQLCTALSERTDTPQFSSMVSMCLNTVTSWKACLVEHFRKRNTSTIETTLKPTIDLRILNSYLSKIMHDDIIKAAMQHGGSWPHALPAARYVNAACLNINSTLELSAIENAIEQGHISHPDAIADSPAWEPIIVAMKPLDGTFAENAETWGVAGLNVDGGRVKSNDNPTALRRSYGYTPNTEKAADSEARGAIRDSSDPLKKALPNPSDSLGRWPANLLLDEESAAMLDRQSGSKPTSGQETNGKVRGDGMWNLPDGFHFGDSGGASRFFFVAKSSRAERNEGCEGETWESEDQGLLMDGLNQHAKDISDDTLRTLGSCSWSIALSGLTLTVQSLKALTFTISTTIKLITALKISGLSQDSNIKGRILDATATIKANGLSLAESVAHIERLISISTNESMASALGASLVALKMLSGISSSVRRGNGHPTVKPLSLMKYLCLLTKTPTGGIVLDPFCGSGSTLWAAEFHNRPWIGIEMNLEYVKIANARLARERSQMKMNL